MNMQTVYYYQTEVEWNGEREGDLQGPNLPVVALDAPPEFKGGENEMKGVKILLSIGAIAL